MMLAFDKLPALEKIRCLDSAVYHGNKTPKIGSYALQTLNNFIKAIPKVGELIARTGKNECGLLSCDISGNEKAIEVYYRIRAARDFFTLSSIMEYLTLENQQADRHLNCVE